MSKLKDPEELLLELGVTLKHDCGRFKGRNIRLCGNGFLDIGEVDKTFDRFANSVEFSFDLLQKKGQRQFLNWIKA